MIAAPIPKSTAELVNALRPGDHLLYNVENFFFDPVWFVVDWIIRVKTWSTAAHIEIYDGDGLSLAARSGGVNRYAFRRRGLIAVRRPGSQAWNHAGAREWFERVAIGQRYDYLGLLCFTLAVKQGSPDKMFCSEFAREMGPHARFNAFDDDWPGDKTAPGSFFMVHGFTTVFSV